MTNHQQRPTHTVIVPMEMMPTVLSALMLNKCTFTGEPSPTLDVWHVGVFQDGVDVVNRYVATTADVGTLGEWRAAERRATGEDS